MYDSQAGELAASESDPLRAGCLVESNPRRGKIWQNIPSVAMAGCKSKCQRLLNDVGMYVSYFAAESVRIQLIVSLPLSKGQY
jgi:hypothetical protein